MEGAAPFRRVVNLIAFKSSWILFLALDNRYHEGQKENGSHQDKKPQVAGSESSRPPQEFIFLEALSEDKSEGEDHSSL
ncbi:hypothetical protein O181_005024 [Austropuccinia psidii MF-1]|uniref:Uncharacterized protein n=1 Tax=Austropuccinia psidii MF-1 TaxID=1389203 RepID=A0A9Q3GFH0_9BASI|nr:hypothetical protein [Austropuccinia psidii MF-1]